MDLELLKYGEMIDNVLYINYNKDKRPTLTYANAVTLYRKLTGMQIESFILTIHIDKKTMKNDIVSSYPKELSYCFQNEDDLEGLCCYPQDVFIFDGNDNINTYSYILLHELTHYGDHHDFCAKFCGGNSERYKKHELYECFAWWSEFHSALFVDKYRLENLRKDLSFDFNMLQDKEKNKIIGLIKNNKMKYSLYDILRGLARIISLSIDVDVFENDYVNSYNLINKAYELLRCNMDFLSASNNFQSFLSVFDDINRLEFL